MTVETDHSAVLFHPDLSDGAKITFLKLRARTPDGHPFHWLEAVELCNGKSKASRHLAELMAASFIQKGARGAYHFC